MLELMRVGEVMDKDFPAIGPEMTVAELSRRIANGEPAVSRRQGTLIVTKENNLAGIITRGDVLRSLQHEPSGAMTVLEAGKQQLVVAYPDEPLHDAITRMLRHDIGRLPVVSRQQPSKAVGYLGRSGVLAARGRQQEEEEIRGRGPIFSFARASVAHEA